jgi:hypothetical protein
VKWDIDKALVDMEPESCKGTRFERILMQCSLLKQNGMEPTAAEKRDGFSPVWCLSLGRAHEPKFFIYARTMRAVYLRARKLMKAGHFGSPTPWGFVVKKRKKVEKKPKLNKTEPKSKKGSKR